MHVFLIICSAAIISIVIFFIIPIWACSLASFIAIIALVYMLNDYLEDRRIKRAQQAYENGELGFERPIDESYPEWDRTEEPLLTHEREHDMSRTSPRKKTIRKYMELFELDEVRATNLYDGGYPDISTLKQASISDLIKIKGINPTMARKIQLIIQREGNNSS
jgi:hypothetical protein